MLLHFARQQRLCSSLLCFVFVSGTNALLKPDDVLHRLTALNGSVYVYDLAGAGFFPSMDDMRPNGPFCEVNSQCNRHCKDLCAYSFGWPQTNSSFMASYQGVLWGGREGRSAAIKVHRRLMSSELRTSDPSRARMFFIPLYLAQTIHRSIWDLPPVFPEGPRNVTALWRWMLTQPSFASSDGSDHFVVTDRPATHAFGKV